MTIPLSDILLFLIFICVFLIGIWIGWDEHENHREFWETLNERLFGSREKD